MGKYEKVLKITSFRYKKPEWSDEDFVNFCTEHGAQAARIQQKHGALKVAQVSPLPSAQVPVSLKANV
jgi:hypothetical protein